MSELSTAGEHRYEHSRRRLGAAPSRVWEVMASRALRPFAGGLVGAAIIVLFLALRGGVPSEVNELTGTAFGGWSRHADVHLLIVVNAAIGAAIAVNFVVEWIHHWFLVALGLMAAGILIAIRQLAGLDGVGGAVMLALIIVSLLYVAAVVTYDVTRVGRRSGY